LKSIDKTTMTAIKINKQQWELIGRKAGWDEPEIDRKLNVMESRINSSLGTSHTPGTESCCFWSGNQSSSDNGLYQFRMRNGELIFAATKEELLEKMTRYYDTIANTDGLDTSDHVERFKANERAFYQTRR
jgi:hypothetical protein